MPIGSRAGVAEDAVSGFRMSRGAKANIRCCHAAYGRGDLVRRLEQVFPCRLSERPEVVFDLALGSQLVGHGWRRFVPLDGDQLRYRDAMLII